MRQYGPSFKRPGCTWVVAGLVCALNVRRIVIAGGMARFGEGLLEPVRWQVSPGALAALADETCIQVTNLEPDIVILGAAALLLACELARLIGFQIKLDNDSILYYTCSQVR